MDKNVNRIVTCELSKTGRVEVDLTSDASKIIDDSGNTWLHEAAKIGREDIIKGFVEMGSNINLDVKNSEGLTPVIIAIQENNENSFNIIKYLIEKGADINISKQTTVKNEKTKSYGVGWTALHAAVSTSQVNIVKLLLENGAKIREAIYYGVNTPEASNGQVCVTPLFIALKCANQEILDMLINAGDHNLRRPLSDGTNALHFAAYSFDISMGIDLLHFNVQARASNCGLTPLHICSELTRMNNYDIGFAMALVKERAMDPFARDSNDQIPYFNCMNIDLLTCFLEFNPSNIDMKLLDGRTKLYSLCEVANPQRDVEMIKLLLNKGANPNIRFPNGEFPSALHRLANCSERLNKDQTQDLIVLFKQKKAKFDDIIRNDFLKNLEGDEELSHAFSSSCSCF